MDFLKKILSLVYNILIGSYHTSGKIISTVYTNPFLQHSITQNLRLYRSSFLFIVHHYILATMLLYISIDLSSSDKIINILSLVILSITRIIYNCYHTLNKSHSNAALQSHDLSLFQPFTRWPITCTEGITTSLISL